MKRMTVLLGTFLLLLLTACSSGGTPLLQASSAPDEREADGQSPVAAALADTELSARARLALGTMQLNESGWPVDESQAAELLVLWQALVALDASATTAGAETSALVAQIESTLRPEQQRAIAGMDLALDELGTTLGRGFGGQTEGEPPGAALRGGGGALPGGGGRPGGGGPGGLGGGPGGAVEPEALATRRAEAGTAFGPDRLATQAVVRWLQQVTGEAPLNARNPIGTVLEIVSKATGLSQELLETEMQSASLASIIEANGGDVAAVQAELVAAMADTNLAERVDSEVWAADLLAADPEASSD